MSNMDSNNGDMGQYGRDWILDESGRSVAPERAEQQELSQSALLRAIIEATEAGRLEWYYAPGCTGAADLGPWHFVMRENDEGLPYLEAWAVAGTAQGISWAWYFHLDELFELERLVKAAVARDKEKQRRAYDDLMSRLKGGA